MTPVVFWGPSVVDFSIVWHTQEPGEDPEKGNSQGVIQLTGRKARKGPRRNES
jgi:hypothetical protein